MSNLLAAIAGVTNASEPLPGLVTGGQPTGAHITALKAAGCEVVVDNRDPMEPRPFDEPATVRAAGMEYVNVPIVHGAATTDTMRRMHEVVRGLKARKALFHCSSGNRTAAALIPSLMLDQGMDEQAAVETAIRIGMRSAELMELALEYVRTRKG
ncbi:MAG TPA: sulfur transferase domain-containing protein [Gemmatimonadales bacterium]|jgi:protein tyrosine phosphatase (PTP) superfamily phosphohydrolase (DUF442 family)